MEKTFNDVDSILEYAKGVFENNESCGEGEQVDKALKLLEIVAKEDLLAKKEGRKFDSSNIEIDIEEIAPDPVAYARERGGFWDGGDDEDYFTCCFDYSGDDDLLFIVKNVLSREAKNFMEDIIEEAMGIATKRLDDMYDNKLDGHYLKEEE